MDSGLPPGWKEGYDKERKRAYWYNSTTKESVWEKPSLKRKQAQQDTSLPPHWVEKFDNNYQRIYWVSLTDFHIKIALTKCTMSYSVLITCTLSF